MFLNEIKTTFYAIVQLANVSPLRDTLNVSWILSLPTPSGVPVKTMSPGCNEKYLTISDSSCSILNIIKLVYLILYNVYHS